MSKKAKLTKLEFVLKAIETLDTIPEKPGFRSKGRVIHTVYSGFNAAYREYFDSSDPVVDTKEFLKQGLISHRLVRGGALIARPGVLASGGTDGASALSKMKLGPDWAK